LNSVFVIMFCIALNLIPTDMTSPNLNLYLLIW
jgi:hypothetical protein